MGVSLGFSGTLTPNCKISPQQDKQQTMKFTHKFNDVGVIKARQKLQLFDIH